MQGLAAGSLKNSLQKIEEEENQGTRVMPRRVGASQGQRKILFPIIVVKKGTTRASANSPRKTRRKIKKETMAGQRRSSP